MKMGESFCYGDHTPTLPLALLRGLPWRCPRASVVPDSAIGVFRKTKEKSQRSLWLICLLAREMIQS